MMSIQYPKGATFQTKSNQYPHPPKKSTYYGKRGMNLEEEIGRSNQYYLEKKQAVIHKKPTPIQVVKVDYPKRTAAVIREAYYRQSSTTDFNGVYKGTYIDFEAKETKNKTSFPLKNFHEHQIQHMNQCQEQGGITFVIIFFSTLNRVFLLENQELTLFWKNKNKTKGRKSIPLAYIEKKGFEIPFGYHPPLDYLKAVDALLLKKQDNQ